MAFIGGFGFWGITNIIDSFELCKAFERSSGRLGVGIGKRRVDLEGRGEGGLFLCLNYDVWIVVTCVRCRILLATLSCVCCCRRFGFCTVAGLDWNLGLGLDWDRMGWITWDGRAGRRGFFFSVYTLLLFLCSFSSLFFSDGWGCRRLFSPSYPFGIMFFFVPFCLGSFFWMQGILFFLFSFLSE
jgi:hypothetical protein